MFFQPPRPAHPRRRPTPPVRPALEQLESRLTPYSATGNAWPRPELITLSFAPDGTVLGASDSGSVTSRLFAAFNSRFGSASAWQGQILKAAQQWAAQANVNFAVVSDNGAASGSGSYQQGDPGFGDIRVAGCNFGTSSLAISYLPPPVNNYSLAGDVAFNTGQTFNVGSTYDLFTVAMHEIGHALGLGHGSLTSVMNSSYMGVKSGLTSDDVSGIRAVYGARANDAYDAKAANGTFAAATDLTGTVNASTLTSLVENLDVTTTADKDFYKVTVPSGTTGTMVVKMQSSGLSLLAPRITAYASDQATVKGTAAASSTDYDGTTLTVTVTGVSAGQSYYLKAEGLNTTAFGTGKYALALNFGGGATPTAAPPNTATANGSPMNGSGGVANRRDTAGDLVAGLGDLVSGATGWLGGLLGGILGEGSPVENDYFETLSPTDDHGHHGHGHSDDCSHSDGAAACTCCSPGGAAHLGGWSPEALVTGLLTGLRDVGTPSLSGGSWHDPAWSGPLAPQGRGQSGGQGEDTSSLSAVLSAILSTTGRGRHSSAGDAGDAVGLDLSSWEEASTACFADGVSWLR